MPMIGNLIRMATILILTATFIGYPSETRPEASVEKGQSGKVAPKTTSAPQIKVATNGTIKQCKERGLQNKILFLVSRYCPMCKKVKPVIEKLVRDEELELYYEPLDLTHSFDRKQLEGYNIEVQFVPTLIVDCRVYVGAKKPEQYQDIIKTFKYGS